VITVLNKPVVAERLIDRNGSNLAFDWKPVIPTSQLTTCLPLLVRTSSWFE
jgi:hypothetical protein